MPQDNRFAFLTSPSFDPHAMRLAATEISFMDDEEYVDLLKKAGYGDHAIEIELEALHTYREQMTPLVEEPPEEKKEEPIKDDPWSQASFKSRIMRKTRENRRLVDEVEE